jgi:hypothetical protein
MLKDIPYFVFCYKFYLIIQKIKAKFLVGEISSCAGIAKLYEYLTLNAILACRVISTSINIANTFVFIVILTHLITKKIQASLTIFMTRTWLCVGSCNKVEILF